MKIEEMIEKLRYKANNIKAHIEPELFNEVADRLEKYQWIALPEPYKRRMLDEKIDLYKLLQVEEGEKFKIEGFKYIYFIQNGYLYFIHEDGEQKSCLNINDVAEKNIIKLPKKKEFSQDTLKFFKYIDKEYKWIAKDKNDTVCTFREKPIKKEKSWVSFEEFNVLGAFKDNLFDEILWEDEEPVHINDYVER